MLYLIFAPNTTWVLLVIMSPQCNCPNLSHLGTTITVLTRSLGFPEWGYFCAQCPPHSSCGKGTTAVDDTLVTPLQLTPRGARAIKVDPCLPPCITCRLQGHVGPTGDPRHGGCEVPQGRWTLRSPAKNVST